MSAARVRRRLVSTTMTVTVGVLSALCVLPLALIFGYLVAKGATSLNLAFFLKSPVPVGQTGGGVANAIVGSILTVGLAAAIGDPAPAAAPGTAAPQGTAHGCGNGATLPALWHARDGLDPERSIALVMLAGLAQVGLFQLDLNGHCLFVNETWTELTGMTADDAMGPGWLAIVHPDDRLALLVVDDKLVRAARQAAEGWRRLVETTTPPATISVAVEAETCGHRPIERRVGRSPAERRGGHRPRCRVVPAPGQGESEPADRKSAGDRDGRKALARSALPCRGRGA